jgi:hypothetical protein
MSSLSCSMRVASRRALGNLLPRKNPGRLANVGLLEDMRLHGQLRLHGLLGLLLGLAVLVGCGSELDTEFGAVMPPAKRTSINGLGVFEKMCTQADIRCNYATKLSPRLERSDVIVLVGATFHPPAKEARDWLEEWLAEESGRTVVYFGRDFNAEIYYRQRTLPLLPASERKQAELQLALAEADEASERLRDMDRDHFCRWFTLRAQDAPRAVTGLSGPWAESVAPAGDSWPVRIWLDPPQLQPDGQPPKWTPPPPSTTSTVTNAGGIRVRRTDGSSSSPRSSSSSSSSSSAEAANGTGGQSSQPPDADAPPSEQPDSLQTSPAEPPELTTEPDWNILPDTYRSHWHADDIGDEATWNLEWQLAPEHELLLADDQSRPLVTRLTSDTYPGSQILLVANGYPLLNGALVSPFSRQVARKLIEELSPAERLTFVRYDSMGLLISHSSSDNQGPVGMELLTLWPLNMVTMHLALFGIILCVILLPILGRPQAAPARSLSNFGSHVISTGELLQKSRDTAFAERAIRAYFREVKGESEPSWLREPSQGDSS